MPRLNPEARASQCAFTFSDGRHCRMPRVPAGEGYCATHARKIRELKDYHLSIDSILQPLSQDAIASTNLTFVLVRLLVEVSRGRISPKLSNALLRILETLRRTLPDTSNEFARTFEPQPLRQIIRNLYQEHEDYIGPAGDTSPSSSETRNSANPSDSPSTSSPEVLDFLLKGRPLCSPVTPKDVDTFYNVLERKFTPDGTPRAKTASQK